jgi:hypothetical protein
VVARLPNGANGQAIVSANQFSPQLGATLGEWTAPARRLLLDANDAPPDKLSFELLMDRTAGGAGSGLLRGLGLAPGGGARRPVSQLPVGDLDRMRRLAGRRRNLEELLERSGSGEAWVAQVVRLTEGLPTNSGGELVFQLADGYRTTGRLDLAADTYYLLARNYPEHPLAEQALRWLVQYYASSEAGQRASNPQSEIRDSANAIQQTSATAPLAGEKPPAIGLSREERLRRAVELGKYLEAARPALFAEPQVRFPLVAAERQLGFANPAKRYFLTLRSLPESDPWRRSARTEEWLAEPGETPPPKMLGHCRVASERPLLDGKLDEAFWQAGEPLRLSNVATGVSPVEIKSSAADEPSATTVRLAYDKDFLYLAVRCAKVAGVDYAPSEGPRPRDGDLTPHDRVTLSLDLDRDYTTAISLVADHRGWTQDACWGDSTWNPAWYVAAAADEAAWTVEAAVPLAELTKDPPTTRQVWAVGVERTIPRVGRHFWAAPAGKGDSPEQFGLLIFD